jgi:geranylgeranyl pyrophosphate synthase
MLVNKFNVSNIALADRKLLCHMDKSRKSIMEETRKSLHDELERIRSIPMGLHPKFSEQAFELLEKQVQKLSIRGPFVRMVYEYVVEQAQLEGLEIQAIDELVFHTHLAFLLEGAICVQYHENRILDGKAGVLDGAGNPDLHRIRLNLLAGHYLKDFLYDYAAKSVFPADGSHRDVLLESLRKMFQFVDLGQFAELQWSNLENFQQGLRELPVMSAEVAGFFDHALVDYFWGKIRDAGVGDSRELFVRFYLQRVYLTGAALFVLAAELVMNLLEYQGTERNSLRRFAGHYGMLCQLSNDNNDFLPPEFGQSTVAKDAKDAFSDLRKGNITLPMFFFFEQNPHETCENLMQLEGMKICQRFKEALWEKSIPLVEHFADELATQLNSENYAAKTLRNLNTIALKTRYLSDFETLYKTADIPP